MRKRRRGLLFLMMVVCLLAGMVFLARPRIRLPENPRVYEQKIYEDSYAYLTYEDKIFVPYCPYEANYLGKCIGYYDIPESEYSDACRGYVCEMKGYSSDAWIIDVLDLNCSEGMILREINTVDIPDDIISEYEWNK